MKKLKPHRTAFINKILISVFCVLAVAVLIIFINRRYLELHFDTFMSTLDTFEKAISQMGSDWVVLFAIFALFIAKCYLPIPLTFICLITGMVYDTGIAFLINMAAMIVEMSIKYVEGIFFGGGMAEKVVNLGSNQFLRRLIDFNGAGNPYILFFCRMIPFISPNMISRMYGALKVDYLYYICISSVGLIPRIYVYTAVGHTLFNPFSEKFILLVIVMVLFLFGSGIACNTYYGYKMNQYNDIMMFVGEKPKYKIVLGEKKDEYKRAKGKFIGRKA